MLRSFRHFVVASPLALAACSSQANTSYRGEALVQLHGTVEDSAQGTSAANIPPLGVELAWSGLLPGTYGKVSTNVPETDTLISVSGQFPASFTLQVYTPPPAVVRLACSRDPGSPHVASAQIEAVSVSNGDSWGYVTAYELVYVDADLGPSNPCFPFALAAGYHLGSFTWASEPGCTNSAFCFGTIDGFQEVPQSTPLTLQLTPPPVGGATPPPTDDGGAILLPADDGGVTPALDASVASPPDAGPTHP
jgi:hypothetical protein